MDSSDSLVELIFAKCALVYGRDFLMRWEGLNIDEVKADWKRELGAWLQQPSAIRHALNNLPNDRPPTVLQFRQMCRSRPEQPAIEMAHVPASREAVRAAIANVGAPSASADPRRWAHRLRIREQNCERLTPAQRAMWRAALEPRQRATEEQEAATA